MTDAEQFAQEGWLVVRGAFDATRVAELIAALDAVVPEFHYAHGYGGRVLEIPSISRGSTAILANARDARVAALAASALGVARVRFFQDTVFIKPPRSPSRVEWHQDFSYFAYFEAPRALTVRLALTPCTDESGCLRVISGSHHWGLQGGDLSFRATTVDDAFGALSPALQAEARARETRIELEPGDLSFHHCLTFHSSADNRSDRARKTLAVRLVDAELRVDVARLPTPEAAALIPTDDERRLRDAAFPIL